MDLQINLIKQIKTIKKVSRLKIFMNIRLLILDNRMKKRYKKLQIYNNNKNKSRK